jgi:lipopolysaccharide export system ATP-binding protein
MRKLHTSELSKTYRGRRVVDGLSICVEQGEVVGLLGPNGAGKTTSFYMIVGLISPDSGRVVLDDTDITTLPMYQRARKGISYLPQEPSVFRGLSVEDNILLYLETFEPDRRRRAQRLDGLLAEFDLTDIRRQNAARLSGGQRRRCEIARALAAEPSYMLLDEPFAGVDPLAVSNIQQTIHALRARDIGVLVSDHNVRETLSIVDRAYVMVAGGIIAHGEPAGIVADENVRRFYLGNSLDR